METNLGDALLEKAEDNSSAMFDHLVDEYLQNRIVDVVINWVPTDEYEDDGTQIEIPEVSIDGVPAQLFARRLVEYTTTDPTLVQATCRLFEEKIGYLWQSTVDYYEALVDLDEDINELATHEYYEKAKQEMAEQGFTNIGEGELLAAARKLAIEDLGAWVAALDAQAEIVEG